MPGFKTDVTCGKPKEGNVEVSIYIDWFLHGIVVTADLRLQYIVQDKAKKIDGIVRAIKFKCIDFTTIPGKYKAIFSEAIMMSVKKKAENILNP